MGCRNGVIRNDAVAVIHCAFGGDEQCFFGSDGFVIKILQGAGTGGQDGGGGQAIKSETSLLQMWAARRTSYVIRRAVGKKHEAGLAADQVKGSHYHDCMCIWPGWLCSGFLAFGCLAYLCLSYPLRGLTAIGNPERGMRKKQKIDVIERQVA